MVKFIDNKAARSDQFIEVQIDVAAVVEGWRLSVFSYEWLDSEGAVKPLEALKARDQERRRGVEVAYSGGGEIEKPVLGIGLKDTVEIGSGKAALLTLAALGVREMPVHIPKSNETDFKKYVSEV